VINQKTIVNFIVIALSMSVGINEALSWVNSPRCSNDQLYSQSDADNRAAWARTKRTTLSDVTYLTPSSQSEIEANPQFHLYPIYTTPFGFPFVGPGPYGYLDGEGINFPPLDVQLAGANGRASGAAIQDVHASYKPGAVFNEWVCQPGCFTPDQEVLFSSGYVPIVEAMSGESVGLEGISGIKTLTADSTFGDLHYADDEIRNFVYDVRESEQTIIEFITVSNRQISVTKRHALVDQNGSVKPAADFAVGDSFITESGSLDEIVSMQFSVQNVQTYHVNPKNDGLISNIIVSQGVLHGSHRYQFEYLMELNRTIIRENIPDYVLSM
jgi:hypothetical protein